jgi:hypothetical protein
MTNRTPPQVSDWLREEAKNLGEYSERSREVMRIAITTIREQGELIRKISQQNNDLRAQLSPVSSTHEGGGK